MPICEWMTQTTFYDAFAENLRSGFFTGFLTISGFLYSAHTFIIVHMKKEVYETSTYEKRMNAKRLTKPDAEYYQSLRNLSRLILAAVLSGLVTSISHVTIGLIQANWAAVWCVSWAAITFILLIICVIVMGLNLRAWFEFLEEEKRSNSGTKSDCHCSNRIPDNA